MREWRDQYLQGHNNYPHTLEEAYSLLQHHICARRNNGTSGLNASDKNLQQDSQNTVDIVPRIQHSQQLNPGSGRDVVARDDSVVRGADGRIVSTTVTIVTIVQNEMTQQACPPQDTKLILAAYHHPLPPRNLLRRSSRKNNITYMQLPLLKQMNLLTYLMTITLT